MNLFHTVEAIYSLISLLHLRLDIEKEQVIRNFKDELKQAQKDLNKHLEERPVFLDHLVEAINEIIPLWQRETTTFNQHVKFNLQDTPQKARMREKLLDILYIRGKDVTLDMKISEGVERIKAIQKEYEEERVFLTNVRNLKRRNLIKAENNLKTYSVAAARRPLNEKKSMPIEEPSFLTSLQNELSASQIKNLEELSIIKNFQDYAKSTLNERFLKYRAKIANDKGSKNFSPSDSAPRVNFPSLETERLCAQLSRKMNSAIKKPIYSELVTTSWDQQGAAIEATFCTLQPKKLRPGEVVPIILINCLGEKRNEEFIVAYSNPSNRAHGKSIIEIVDIVDYILYYDQKLVYFPHSILPSEFC